MSDPLNLMNALFKWLATKLDIAENTISPTSHLINDLNSNDSKNVEIGIELGNRFAVTVSSEEAGKIETVQDIFDILDKKIKTESKS